MGKSGMVMPGGGIWESEASLEETDTRVSLGIEFRLFETRNVCSLTRHYHAGPSHAVPAALGT